MRWVEGGVTIFDDSVAHSARNDGATPRVILHVAFPHPALARSWRRAGLGQPRSFSFGPLISVPSPSIATTTNRYFEITLYGNCTAQTCEGNCSVIDGRRSAMVPIAELYNRVSDNHQQDSEACIAAALVSGTSDVFRLTAAHAEYGTLDLKMNAHAEYVVFEVADTSRWTADPANTHIKLGVFGSGILDPAKAPFVAGKFQGQRGAEGEEDASTGFFTLSTVWQSYNAMFYAKSGDRLAFTFCPTVALPRLRTELATLAGEAAPNPNRARTWYWTTHSSEANIDTVINRTKVRDHPLTQARSLTHSLNDKTLGAELVFFLDITSNIGDYEVDQARFPHGFRATAQKVLDAGLRVGLHLISSGADRAASVVAASRPELFVPQGLSPWQYYPAFDAGTWWCHEKTGSVCYDSTRPQVDPMHPKPTLPPNHMNLTNVQWSTLGIYRSGGALGFDGRQESAPHSSCLLSRSHSLTNCVAGF
jgi:hypothetical protein